MRGFLIGLVLTFFGCNGNNWLSEKPIRLVEIQLENSDSKIYLYKSFSNATVTESIQIRTEDDLENAKVVFERYDLVLGHSLEGESLQLILQDTSGYKTKTDTILVDINSFL